MLFDRENKLHVIAFEFDDLHEINLLHQRSKTNTNVSITDCSVWYYAKKNSFTLLTGDRKLRSSAQGNGVRVHGIIYVFDELVANGILHASLAAEKLSALKSINPRLPYNEIEKRLKLWTDEPSKEGGCL